MTATFDALGEPPTGERIREWRREAGSADDVGLIAMLLTPVPFLDAVVGAAAGGYDHVVNGPAREALEDDAEATARDWSDVPACERYVRLVREGGRSLVRGETASLERLRSADRTVRHAVTAGVEAAIEAVGALVGGKGP